MSKQYEVRITAERFIHNELSNSAHWFQKVANTKIETDEREGCALDMMAAIMFCAFSVEAKVNFVGWKTLQAGWPERASLREKVNLLNETLSLNLNWGSSPLQRIAQLKRFRDTLAHGKPEIVDETKLTDVEPEVWDALKSQWETTVTQDFMNRCRDDEEKLWSILLEAAGIGIHETLTHGGHHLSVKDPF